MVTVSKWVTCVHLGVVWLVSVHSFTVSDTVMCVDSGAWGRVKVILVLFGHRFVVRIKGV